MEQFLRVAQHAAVTAGALLREHVGGVREISYKGAINLVTEMDHRAERTIVAIISAAFPDHGILSEEGACRESSSEFLWMIDPLDGTTNYAHGYPNFAVSIGLAEREEMAVGVVYDPMRDELYTAERSRGAFLNARPIRVSQSDRLIRSLLATGFPYDRAESDQNNLNFFNAMIMACQEIRRSGSAALDLCSVAAGRLDGYWELKLHPWDVAAGSLIVREAGGSVTDLSGGRSDVRDKEIIASNGIIHAQILDVMNRVRYED